MTADAAVMCRCGLAMDAHPTARGDIHFCPHCDDICRATAGVCPECRRALKVES